MFGSVMEDAEELIRWIVILFGARLFRVRDFLFFSVHIRKQVTVAIKIFLNI